MSRVVLITSNHRRHVWLAGKLAEAGHLVGLVSEAKPAVNPASRESPDTNVAAYFSERERREAYWFSQAPETLDDVDVPVSRVHWGKSNSAEVMDFVQGLSPDFVLLFGSSIIRAPLLSCYSGRILNMHLGLSPYYRGSGTNFWPLVDNVPECIGVTIHHATLQVDGGDILRQARPQSETGDGSHDLGCKTIMEGTQLVLDLLEGSRSLPAGVPQSGGGRLCRRADFTPSALVQMRDNFTKGMMSHYLADKSNRDARYPIITG